MKTVRSALVALSVIGATAVFVPANGHDWYPKDCCHDMDCAPVENIVRFVPAGGGAPQLIVTSKHGKATVRQDFPVRQSKDSNMHVCIRRHDSGEMDVICLFIPPGV
jgi:hypothetical protein